MTSPSTPVTSRIPRSLLVLRHRDFALVQLGNGVSQIGTWGQYIALGWSIRELSSSPFAVSLSLVAQFLPFLLFLHVMGAILAFGPTFAYSIMGAMAGATPKNSVTCDITRCASAGGNMSRMMARDTTMARTATK